MHIERIHKMVECLTEKTLSELDKGIENVNVEEMSEAVDMINWNVFICPHVSPIFIFWCLLSYNKNFLLLSL